MNAHDETLGARIKKCGEIAGSISQLSRITDIPRGTLVDYANNKTEPTRSRLVAIARAAGVRLEWLMTGEEPMYPSPLMAGSQAVGVPLEPALMGRVVEVVRRALVELSIRLPDSELGQLYLEIYAEILSKAEDAEDYAALLELAGNRVRRDLLKEKPGSGKRSASGS